MDAEHFVCSAAGLSIRHDDGGCQTSVILAVMVNNYKMKEATLEIYVLFNTLSQTVMGGGKWPMLICE